MRRFCFGGLFAAFLLTLLIAGSASANSAPPRWYGQKGGVLLPGTSSEIHVTHETLRFEIPSLVGYSTARVTALYQMENRGPALTDFPVVFVIEGMGDPTGTVRVTLDGKNVPNTPVDTSHLTDAEKAQMSAAWGAMA